MIYKQVDEKSASLFLPVATDQGIEQFGFRRTFPDIVRPPNWEWAAVGYSTPVGWEALMVRPPHPNGSLDEQPPTVPVIPTMAADHTEMRSFLDRQVRRPCPQIITRVKEGACSKYFVYLGPELGEEWEFGGSHSHPVY